ncbi:MAG: helix-turn-helix transcriptional regulator [Planctomycetota bacterium]|nr:helix-turn-helix transcriptional regulator [Planctomycetota bacterium]
MERAIDILNVLSQRRRRLGMSLDELARRCGVPVSTLKRVLGGEVAASFSTVSAVAEALGVSFAQAHAEDISAMRDRQARLKARALVALVQGTSALEGQGVDPADIELMEQRTAAQLLSGPARRLWAR